MLGIRGARDSSSLEGFLQHRQCKSISNENQFLLDTHQISQIRSLDDGLFLQMSNCGFCIAVKAALFNRHSDMPRNGKECDLGRGVMGHPPNR